jgi:hypothetical protein
MSETPKKIRTRDESIEILFKKIGEVGGLTYKQALELEDKEGLWFGAEDDIISTLMDESHLSETLELLEGEDGIYRMHLTPRGQKHLESFE